MKIFFSSAEGKYDFYGNKVRCVGMDFKKFTIWPFKIIASYMLCETPKMKCKHLEELEISTVFKKAK